MVIGIIGAMDIETEKLKQRLENTTTSIIAKMNFCSGKVGKNQVVICNCFEGKVNAAVGTQLLISKFNVDIVINIGVAGGVSKELNICDLVVATSAVEFDLDTTVLGYEQGYVFGLQRVDMECDNDISLKLNSIASKYGNTRFGKIASSDKFISDTSITEMLDKKFSAIAVDMETASICHVCNLNNVPFGAIRAISDNCSNMEYKEFLEISLEKLDKIMYEFIEIINK